MDRCHQSIDLSGVMKSDRVDAQSLEEVADGAVNVRGLPSIKSSSGNWKAAILIFGCEACERLAFYAISCNLVGYLSTVLGEDLSVAVQNANNWNGTVRLMPILGAIIADSYLGRFLTIGIFMCVCLLVLVTISVALPSMKGEERCVPGAGSCYQTGPATATAMQGIFFYFSLYLVAFGGGGIKACVLPFANDQFDVTDPVEARRKISCPNWWFIAITSGAVVAVSFLVYAQAALGWSWGYGIPTAATAIWTLVYFFGAPLYRNQVIAGSPLTRVSQVLVCAARNWRMPIPTDSALLHEDYFAPSKAKLLPHSPNLTFLDRAAAVAPTVRPELDDESGDAIKRAKEVINPWEVCTVTQVEEVKMLARVLPIWLTNIMFWVVYAQVTTLFLNQGTTLDRHIGAHFEIPAAAMPVFLHLAICAFLPVYDKVIVPLARAATGEPRGFTILQRVGIGQALSIVPIAVAAVVEIRRLRLANSLDLLPGTPLPMSIFWLLPQYALFGVTEVFLSVGQIDFFTDQVPESMRSLGNAMAFCAISLGCFGSSALVEAVTKLTRNANGGWIGNDLNTSHMDYFYWLLTVLTILNLALYLVVARRYTSSSNILTTSSSDNQTKIVAYKKVRRDSESGSVKRVHPLNDL